MSNSHFPRILIVTLALLTPMLAPMGAKATPYCRGVKEGFQAGYCDGDQYSCHPPVLQGCPLPDGEMHRPQAFRRGYTYGVKLGAAEKARRDRAAGPSMPRHRGSDPMDRAIQTLQDYGESLQ